MNKKSSTSIQKFDPYTIGDGKTIHIIGQRGSGKSSLLMNLIYCFKDKFDYAVFISPTRDSIKAAKKYLPEAFVYEMERTKTSDHVISLLETIVDIAKRYTEGMDNYLKEKPIKMAIIMDDCAFDKKILRSNVIREIHYNGRHFGITFIFCVQFLMDIPTYIRENIDYIFAFSANSGKSQQKLYDYFFGIFPNVNNFKRFLKKFTDNYKCIVYDRSGGSSNKIPDQVFWFKATLDLPPITLGSKFYYEMTDYCKKSRGANKKL